MSSHGYDTNQESASKDENKSITTTYIDIFKPKPDIGAVYIEMNKVHSASQSHSPSHSVVSMDRAAQPDKIRLASLDTPLSNSRGGSGDRNAQPKTAFEVSIAPYGNGYVFPPRYTWSQSAVNGLQTLWTFACTWTGFLVVFYCLNIVGWGAMIFFLLIPNATPAMCLAGAPDPCNDIDSPRRKWIEYDAQILTALFCVTGLGLAYWRFRDLWRLMQYRCTGNEVALRHLGGIHRTWLRLPGSQSLDPRLGPLIIEANNDDYLAREGVAFPLSKIPDAPLTGVRASPTPLWKLDLVIWFLVWNTILQCVLNGIMWGMTRYNRPSVSTSNNHVQADGSWQPTSQWATGLFVALACIVAIAAGLIQFFEARRVKAIEGVPLTEKDRAKLNADREAGIHHYNNYSGKAPKVIEEEVHESQ